MIRTIEYKGKFLFDILRSAVSFDNLKKFGLAYYQLVSEIEPMVFSPCV